MTRLVEIETLLPRVMEKAAACPEPQAINKLRDAAIEFCRRTKIWRLNDYFSVAAGSDCEPIPVPQQAELYRVETARFDTTPLDLVTVDWLTEKKADWRTETGPPAYLTQDTPNTLIIVPKPEAAGTITLDIILEPRQSADSIPDFIVEKYPAVIADGALGEILSTPGDYQNANLAAHHMKKFERALGRWGDLIPKGQQRAPRRVKPHHF